ncbi:CrcB protein [Mycetocola sp. CAN_C7]|uniref:fluoride efflux transporter FluC n=1 Tax=Mycetocola sp. CAN_C7 TaxID=2787724 RepID=UPI001A24C797
MRPPHLQPTLIAIVIVGGAFGTAAREALSLSIASIGSFPLAIFLINVVGSFALGLLLEGLVRSGADTGRRRNVRLLAGTGFLGGFTTYSALATDTDLLLRAGDIGIGILYAVGTLLVGLVAAWAGIVIAASTHRRRNNPGVGA